MPNILTRKLELFGAIPDDDKRLLDELIVQTRVVGARRDIIREGHSPINVLAILDGFACRYKILPNGDRQIFAYLVPGDMCDPNVFILDAMDHTIGTLSACRIAEIPRKAILELTAHPAIARSLGWATLVDEAVLREWLVNLGQRSAEHRIAHLFCELHTRLQAVGLVKDGNLRLPVTQSDLADTLGLSSVHINRSLQRLRLQELIVLTSGSLSIPDVDRLRAFCGFRSNYLHLHGGKHDPSPDAEPSR